MGMDWDAAALRAAVQRHLSGLTTCLPAETEPRPALHDALLSDVASVDAWSRVLAHQVPHACVCAVSAALQSSRAVCR